MLIVEDIEVKWSGRNRLHFESLGYKYTKNRDPFTVKSTELSNGSHFKVRVLCDYCEVKIMERAFRTHVRQTENDVIKKDACVECRPLKMKESNLQVYGTEWFTQTEDFKSKAKETNLERYGNEFYQKTDEYREKYTATNLERYGVEHPSQREEYLQKRDATMLERYGVTNPMHVPEFQEKMMRTLYESGDAPASTQQRYIHSLIGGELNYPKDTLWLDIAFPTDKVYVEYDGGGHDLQVKFKSLTQEEFDKKERNRSFFLYRKGWKEIRIISEKDKLPEDFVIVNFVDKARSFFNSKKVYSVQYNVVTKKVIINYKQEYEINEFLSDSFTVDKVNEVA